VAEVIAKSFVAFARLVARGEPERAHTSALARFAIAQTFSGRRVGGRLRVRDVLSPYAQRRKRLRVTRLDEYDEEARVWREIFVRDLSPSPAALAASRIDFADWLDRLPSFVRRIALSLASGETTSEAAKLFRLSPGRISQIRRWLWESWQTFQGDRRR
jgi:hypothetical protein